MFLIPERRHPLHRHWLPVLLLGTALAVSVRAAETDPWRMALNFDYNLAAEELARRHAADPSDLRSANAYASSLLVRQPRTAANLEAARGVLESVLVRATPDDTDQSILARYLLARLDHEHVSPPRLEAARTRYEELVRDHPGHPLADHAAVHLALLRTLQLPPADSTEAVTLVERLLAGVTAPSARRELHHLLAHLHWHGRRDAAAALPHYQAGRAIGFEAPYRNGEVDLTIAGLATETGRDDLTAQHFLAFAQAYPRDGRAQTARRLAAEALARLEAVRP
jgi:hypothetical protein